MSEIIDIKKYDFSQTITGLEAFLGVFEKRLQEIHEEIPVMVLNTGDETYLFKKKFQKVEDIKEIYLSVPRVVFDFDDASLQTDQNTSQYTYSTYVFNNILWEAQFRRQSLLFPVSCNLVCSNFIRSLQYFDMLASLLSIDNVFTYQFLNNNHDGSYNAQNFSFEKATMDQGSSSKNFVVKASIELSLQIWLPRYSTIKQLNGFELDSTDSIQFGIETNDNNGTNKLSILKNPNDECENINNP